MFRASPYQIWVQTSLCFQSRQTRREQRSPPSGSFQTRGGSRAPGRGTEQNNSIRLTMITERMMDTRKTPERAPPAMTTVRGISLQQLSWWHLVWFPWVRTEASPVVIMLPPVDPITSVFDGALSTVGAMEEGGCSPANTTKGLSDRPDGSRLHQWKERGEDDYKCFWTTAEGRLFRQTCDFYLCSIRQQRMFRPTWTNEHPTFQFYKLCFYILGMKLETLLLTRHFCHWRSQN